jgi:hypothetical protein
MTRELLHRGDIHAFIQQVRDKRAPEIMGGKGFQPSNFPPLLQPQCDRLAGDALGYDFPPPVAMLEKHPGVSSPFSPNSLDNRTMGLGLALLAARLMEAK